MFDSDEVGVGFATDSLAFFGLPSRFQGQRLSRGTLGRSGFLDVASQPIVDCSPIEIHHESDDELVMLGVSGRFEVAVQQIGVQIGAIRPADRADLGVNSHLPEQDIIP